jgi:hypothetical protein
VSGATSATAPVILSRTSAAFTDTDGTYILSITNPHKKCLVELDREIEVAMV